MKRTVEESLENRRSYYAIGNDIAVSEERIEALVHHAARYVPSAFNSQSTRLVLLVGKSHTQFWSIVRDTLRDITPSEIFAQTEKKIDRSFANGYGTILFFEDMETVEKLKKDFPIYKEAFLAYADHTSAMHQLALWLMFEDEGLGVSLQHYNPLIDETVREAFALPKTWKLVAQMPFGNPKDTPGEKTYLPIEEKVRVFH